MLAQPFSVAPFPNRAGAFLRHSAFQSPQAIASGIGKDLRIAQPCNPGSSDPLLLPPFALPSAFPMTLGGRDSSGSYGGSVTICFAAGR